MTLDNVIGFGVSRLFSPDLLRLVCFLSALNTAQELAPRAYVITPVHSNAVTLTYAFFSGNLLLDGTLPITGATARANVTAFTYTHSLRILGRSANFSASFPYGIGKFHGTVLGAETRAYLRVGWILPSVCPLT